MLKLTMKHRHQAHHLHHPQPQPAPAPAASTPAISKFRSYPGNPTTPTEPSVKSKLFNLIKKYTNVEGQVTLLLIRNL